MEPRDPVVRTVLLGASNLKIGLPFLLDRLRRRAGGPVEALAACGHGRSYGDWSRFLFVRRLPGIAACGLWRELAARPARPTLALLTDVGNDLVYGYAVKEIAGWVESCLDRLAQHGATAVLTLPPLTRLEKLTAWQVRLAVSILFPGRDAPWPGLLDRTRDLDGRLRRLAAERGSRLVEPEAGWYGIDPIHLRRSRRREAWERVLSLWPLPPESSDRPGRLRLPLLGAEEARLLGWTLRHPQPAARSADGTNLSLY
jgi:hypothetical protein